MVGIWTIYIYIYVCVCVCVYINPKCKTAQRLQSSLEDLQIGSCIVSNRRTAVTYKYSFNSWRISNIIKMQKYLHMPHKTKRYELTHTLVYYTTLYLSSSLLWCQAIPATPSVWANPSASLQETDYTEHNSLQLCPVRWQTCSWLFAYSWLNTHPPLPLKCAWLSFHNL